MKAKEKISPIVFQILSKLTPELQKKYLNILSTNMKISNSKTKFFTPEDIKGLSNALERVDENAKKSVY